MLNWNQINARDSVEKVYVLLFEEVRRAAVWMTPFLRRVFRFLALPYCFIFLVNWRECEAPKWKVVGHFFYIFFVLRYFPDNYSACRFWEKPISEWKYYYGSTYDPYQRAQLRKKVQPAQYEILYEDKWVCYELCQANTIPIPETFGVINGGQGATTELRELLHKRAYTGRLVAKPISGKGGHGIKFLETCNNGEIRSLKPRGIQVEDALFDCAHIIQPFIDQHFELNAFSESVNTMRVVTMLTADGNVLTIGAYLRFGNANEMVDHLSHGGIAASIDKVTGALSAEAIDRNGRAYNRHPDSGRLFRGFVVPFWPEVLTVTSRAQQSLCFYRLLGFDIALEDTGPVVVEINAIYDNVSLEQVCGPIFKDPAVVAAFGEYSLMINKKQKKLFKELIEYV